tara:strand:+ start:56017 stop:56544 length:528 start_codon:yes stop_codon:yes gene_type:complete
VFVDIPLVAFEDDSHARANNLKFLEDVCQWSLQAQEGVVVEFVSRIERNKHWRFKVDDMNVGFLDVSIKHANSKAANGCMVLVFPFLAVWFTGLCGPCEASQWQYKRQGDVIFTADVECREPAYKAHFQRIVQELAVVFLYNFEKRWSNGTAILAAIDFSCHASVAYAQNACSYI